MAPPHFDAYLPRVLPDSVTAAKRRRYAKWEADPEAIPGELGAWEGRITDERARLTAVEAERQEVDAAYHLLSDGLSAHVALLAQDRAEAEVRENGPEPPPPPHTHTL